MHDLFVTLITVRQCWSNRTHDVCTFWHSILPYRFRP